MKFKTGRAHMWNHEGCFRGTPLKLAFQMCFEEWQKGENQIESDEKVA